MYLKGEGQIYTRPPGAAAEARLILGAQGCASGGRGKAPGPRLRFSLEECLWSSAVRFVRWCVLSP